MIRLAQSILALLFVLSLATACSNSSDDKNAPRKGGNFGGIPNTNDENPNPDNSGPVPNTPHNQPSAQAGDVATLPMTAWCVKFQNEERDYYELLFKFNDNQTASSVIFKLLPDLTRDKDYGPLQPQSGTWSIVGNKMTISFWKPPEFLIYVAKSAESATNQPELRLTQNGETHIFTSCSEE